MRTPILLLLTATLVLSACQSRLNPVNWFGSDREKSVQESANPLIPEQTESGVAFFSRQEVIEYVGEPLQRVTQVETHRVTEGKLIMATGIAAVHGVSNVRLVRREDGGIEKGVLFLDLTGLPPESPVLGGSDLTREATAAIVLTDQETAGARSVRIVAASNSLDARLR